MYKANFMSYELALASVVFAAWYMNKKTGEMTVRKENLGLYLTVLAFSIVSSVMFSVVVVILLENPGFPLVWAAMGVILFLVQRKYDSLE